MSSEVKTDTPVVTPAATAAPASPTAPAAPEASGVVAAPAIPAEPAKPKESYEHLLRESNRVRKLQKELKDKEARIAQKEKEYELLDKDPWAALTKKGVTYEHLIDRIVQGEPAKKAEPPPNKDVEEVKKKLLDIEAKEQQAQAHKYAMDLKAHIDANKDRWELIRETNRYQKVLDLLIEKWNNDGVEVPWDQAADMVEQFLEHTYTKDLDLLFKTNKIRSKFDLVDKSKAPAPAKGAAEVKKEPEVKQAVKEEDTGLDDEWKAVLAAKKAARLATLSNANTTTSPSGEDKPLTREERKKLALARYGDKLITD